MTYTLDNSLDASGFFSDPARRTVLEAAAAQVASRLGDSLSALTPSSGNSLTITIDRPNTGAVMSITNPTIPRMSFRFMSARGILDLAHWDAAGRRDTAHPARRIGWT